jgi:predicted enzyme related to lactoylglutathione lyase
VGANSLTGRTGTRCACRAIDGANRQKCLPDSRRENRERREAGNASRIQSLSASSVNNHDIKRLVRFYEDIGLTATWHTAEFAELSSPSCTLAIGSKRTMDMFGAGAATPGSNRSLIIEFRVHDVDEEYKKLEKLGKDVVQQPTTQPWGNRSILFSDPDGNLINFFTPVTAEAIRKYTKE